MDAAIISWLSQNPTTVPLALIVSLVVFGIIKGWIVPQGTVKDRIADKDAQIANLTSERDNWRQAAQNGELARQELLNQNKALIEGAETTNRLLESMRNLFERQQGHPGPSQTKEPER